MSETTNHLADRLATALAEVGVTDIPHDEMSSLADNVYGELERKVGAELSAGMSDEKLEEFEGYIDAEDEDAAMAFLARECPNSREIVERLTAEIVDQVVIAAAVYFGGVR